MFTAKKTENIDVSVMMLDGTVHLGTLSPGMSVPTLDNALNKASTFLEFTTREGKHRFFSKSQIVSVDAIDVQDMPAVTPG